MNRYLIIALALLAADIATDKIVDWQFAEKHGKQNHIPAVTKMITKKPAYTTNAEKMAYLFSY